jgi:hypothetical protein
MDKPRIGNLRAYLAGTGATGALIAGAILAFVTVGALVAFDGFPLGAGDDSDSVALADELGGQAPETAAVTLGKASSAVASKPAGGSVAAVIRPGAGDAPGPSGTSSTSPAGGGGSATSAGAAAGVIDAVDDATSGTGLPPLGPAAAAVTQGAQDGLNDAVGAVGGGGAGGAGGVGSGLGVPNVPNAVEDTLGVANGLLNGD